MAVSVDCPSCNSAYSLDDNLAGANIRCKVCRTIFQAPERKAESLPTDSAPVQVVAVVEARRVPAIPVPVSPAPALPRPVRREVPRVRRSAPADSSMPAVVLIILGFVVCLLLAGGTVVILAVLFWSNGTNSSNPNQVAGGGADRVIPGDQFVFVQQRVREKKLIDTGVAGMQMAKTSYRQIPTDGGILIGFQVGQGKFVNSPIVDALRPIYSTKNGKQMGSWIGPQPANPITVQAKPGYFVSDISIRTGLLIDGLSLRFTKLDNNRIQVADQYDSEWVGGKGGNPSMIGGQGLLIVGVYGDLNDKGSPCSLGLIAVEMP